MLHLDVLVVPKAVGAEAPEPTDVMHLVLVDLPQSLPYGLDRDVLGIPVVASLLWGSGFE